MNERTSSSLITFSILTIPRSIYSLSPFILSLGLGVIFSSPSDAQTVNYGRSPDLNILTAPSANEASYGFAPTNGWNCPTPSFSIGTFGGAGNDWSDDHNSNYSSSSGINNYGIAVGVTIPLGGDFSRYCNDYAKSLSERARIEMEQLNRNEQITLLQQCYWLVVNKIDTDQPAFEPGGVFSSLSACKDYKYQSIQGGDNQGGDNQGLKVPANPPLSEIKTPPPSNLIIQQQR